MPKVAHPTPRVILKKKSKDAKTGFLYLKFWYDSKKVHYPIGDSVEIKYWNKKAGVTTFNKKYGQEYIDLNSKIQSFKRWALDTYKADHDLSVEDFKKELDYLSGRLKRPSTITTPTLFKFIEDYIETKQNSVSSKRGTWKKFKTVFNNLKLFAEEKKITLDYNDIDWKFREEFVEWMYSPPRKYSANNAAKVFEVIKQFMNEALRLEYHNNKRHQENGFGVKREKVQSKVRVTFEELRELINVDLSERPRWERTRDLFVVGCYTGLRFSDWHKISKDSIEEEDGEKLLEILTEKTKQLVMIPILPELQIILEKYDYILPSVSAQEFNRTIKKVAKLVLKEKTFTRTFNTAGQTKKEKSLRCKWISSHCARRSFASNFYELGVEPSGLMQITGHSTEKQFFEYIDINKRAEAKRFRIIVTKKLEQEKEKEQEQEKEKEQEQIQEQDYMQDQDHNKGQVQEQLQVYEY